MIFSNVNDDEFEINREFEKGNVIYKEVRLKNRGIRCLNCGTYTAKIKEYRLKKFKHSIYNNKETMILYHQRRFICPKCGHTSMEKDPFRSDCNRVSDKTVGDILDMLKRYNVPLPRRQNTSNCPQEVSLRSLTGMSISKETRSPASSVSMKYIFQGTGKRNTSLSSSASITGLYLIS